MRCADLIHLAVHNVAYCVMLLLSAVVIDVPLSSCGKGKHLNGVPFCGNGAPYCGDS